MAKKRLGTGYTFDASEKTIVHADFSDITLAGIQMIVNVTDQIIIYNFADTAKGGTLATDTLTLEYDTTSMSDTDELMILVEDGVATQAITGTVDLGAVDNGVLDAIAASVAAIDSGQLADGHNVTVDNASLTVTATDLDIRALVNTDVVTAELSAVDNAVLDTIDAVLDTIKTDTAAIAAAQLPDGHNVTVDNASLTVDLGANNDVTVTSGAITETNSGGIQTAVQLIDDVIYADDADWTDSTSKHALVGGLYQSTPQTVTDGDVAPFNITANGALHVAVQNGVTVDLGANNDVTVTSGTITAELSATDNAVLDTIDAVLDTINAKLVTGTDIGDVTINNAAGASAVNIQDGGNTITVDGTVAVTGVATAANQTTIIGHVDGIEGLLGTIDADTGSIMTAVQIMDDWDNGASDGASVSGDTAHDTADAGEPVKIGMKAYELDGTAPQTAVAEADRVNAIGDLVGRQYVATEHPRFWHVSADYASAQTNTSVQASPGAGLALYITDIMISNGATAGNITLLNGSGGTVLFEIYPAVNGGVSLNLKNPIKLSDATALCITSTTVTTHSVFVSGFID